jgi:putative DNA primase/helicase
MDIAIRRPDPPPVAIDGAADPCSHLANALRLHMHFRDQLLYVGGIGWHRWGPPWRYDKYAGLRAGAELGRINTEEARQILDAASKPEWAGDAEHFRKIAATRLKWASASESANNITSSLALAESLFVVDAAAMDADPYLLGTPGGVFDLRAGVQREHRQADLITKVAACDYDVDAAAPTFRRFLCETFDGNRELLDYVQTLAGYTLSGHRGEHLLAIFWGSGANGKSTLLGTLQALLGDYAGTAAPDLLIARNGSEHPTQLADLQGRRLVVVSETGEAGRLAEERAKMMTGGDTIKARRMRQDFFEFKPTHQLVLQTNHRPRVNGNDEGIWRRLRLIPFTITVPPDKRDATLPDQIQAELPGVMRWAVEGWLSYQQHGFKTPAAVTVATAGYRDASDVFGAFVADCCVQGEGREVTAADIYSAYSKWAAAAGEMGLSARVFGQRLEDRGFRRGLTGGAKDRKRTWFGLELRDGQ